MSRQIIAMEYFGPDGRHKRISPRTMRVFDVRFSSDSRFVEIQYYGEPENWVLIPIDRIYLITVRDEPG